MTPKSGPIMKFKHIGIRPLRETSSSFFMRLNYKLREGVGWPSTPMGRGGDVFTTPLVIPTDPSPATKPGVKTMATTTNATQPQAEVSTVVEQEQQTTPSMMQAALYWAEQGFRVVPCHEPVFNSKGKLTGCTCRQDKCTHQGKHPRQATLTRVLGQPEERGGGYHQATNDPKVIRSLWQDSPKANIGGSVGAKSGLIAVDIDPRHGGDQSFEQIIEDGIDFPETVENASGGGGRHLIYRYPDMDIALPCKIEVPEQYPGVEFLLNPPSGIILPPSLHPSGKKYRRFRAADAVGIAECSPSMIQFICDHLKPAAKTKAPAKFNPQASSCDFTISSGAKAPEQKLEGLLASHEIFRQTWERKRPEFANDLSRYEQSLADIAVSSGWEGQEIVDLLVEFRERQGEKSKPQSYYQSTLGKARIKKEAGVAVPVTQATQLIEVAHDMTKEFFQDASGIDYAKITLEQGDGHGKIIAADAVLPMAIEGRFRDALEWAYCDRHLRQPAPGEVAKALRQLRRESLRGGRRELEPRSAAYQDSIWIDRGDLAWTAYRVAPDEVSFIQSPPTLWWRPSNMGEMPLFPPESQDLDPWRILHYLNLPTDEQHDGSGLLFLVSLILGYVPNSMITHPMILLTGPEGSAKSSMCDIFKFCVDPPAGRFGEAGRTRLKRGDDLQVVLYNHALVHLDNVSHVTQTMADDLSTGVTGADVAARKFYTDFDQCTIRYRRQILMTAINHPIRANDLISRTLWFPLPMIDPSGMEYLEGEQKMALYLQERPLLVGSHLHILSRALGMSDPKLSLATRFPQWCSLGARVTQALGRPVADFERALRRNMINHRLEALEAQFFARAVYELVTTNGDWEGTLTELVDAAGRTADQMGYPRDDKNFWPQHPRIAGSFLEQATVTLKQLGISYRRKTVNGRRVIEFRLDQNAMAGIDRPDSNDPEGELLPTTLTADAEDEDIRF